MCACGKPLHYLNPHNQRMVEEFVRDLGETLLISVGRRTWRVPRHYIALHGLKAVDLPVIATEYGFEEVEHGGA